VIEDESSPDFGKVIVRKEYDILESENSNSIGKGIKVYYSMNIDFFWNKVYQAFEILDEEATKQKKQQ